MLAGELYAAAQDRETRELGRLQQVLDWVQLQQCQSSALAARFENPLDKDCGHCSWCENKIAVSLSGSNSEPPTPQIIDSAKQLRRQHPELFSSTVELARVLCGVSSPAISRAKMQKHELFGYCENVSFAQVQEALENDLSG